MPSMKLKNREVVSVYNALAQLDQGHQRIVKDGDREKVVFEEFDLTPNFRFAMGVNMNRLDVVAKVYHKTNAELVRKHSVDGKLDAENTPAAWAAYELERTALDETEVEVELTRIGREELKLDKNKIRWTVISMLMPIVTDGEKAAAS